MGTVCLYILNVHSNSPGGIYIGQHQNARFALSSTQSADDLVFFKLHLDRDRLNRLGVESLLTRFA